MFLNVEKGDSPGECNDPTSFNYFNFVSEKSRFVHHFGMADGLNTTIPMIPGHRCRGEEARQRCKSEQ